MLKVLIKVSGNSTKFKYLRTLILLMQNGQGAMEYLMLIGGGVLVAVIIITTVFSLAETSEGGTAATAGSGSDLIQEARNRTLGNTRQCYSNIS